MLRVQHCLDKKPSVFLQDFNLWPHWFWQSLYILIPGRLNPYILYFIFFYIKNKGPRKYKRYKFVKTSPLNGRAFYKHIFKMRKYSSTNPRTQCQRSCWLRWQAVCWDFRTLRSNIFAKTKKHSRNRFSLFMRGKDRII